MNNNDSVEDSSGNIFSLKFNLKTLLIILLIVIAIYFLIPKLIGLEQALLIIHKLKIGYLVLALLFEIISYIGAAALLTIILSRLGYRLTFYESFRISSIAAFAIHFFPIGSLGEGAFDYYILQKKNVPSGSVLLMWVLRIIFTYATFLIIFMIGLALVPVGPNLNFSPKIVSSIIFVLVILGTAWIFYLYKHKQRFWHAWNKIFHLVNSFCKRFHLKQLPSDKSIEAFEDIYQGIGLFGQKKRSSIFAIIAGLIYWLGDIGCLFFVYLSFGRILQTGVLFTGYCAATLAGLISFIPGGLGITEGSMSLVISRFGQPISIVLLAVLVFRLLSFWIWIPVGFYSYLTLRNGKKSHE